MTGKALLQRIFSLVFLISSSTLYVVADDLLDVLPLIPRPSHMTLNEGSFNLTAETPIVLTNNELRNEAELFNDYLQEYYGFRLKISTTKQAKKASVILGISGEENRNSKEAYSLSVKTSGIEIKAPSGTGVFYALQTLIQLLPPGKLSILNIPGIEISDQPRFAWRGMHLDVSRHFFSVEFIKKYIDYLASYKMNTFHWHLTDDQGWRIEIKKFPKLQEISAYRNGTLVGHLGSTPQLFDSIKYGGYYTQEQIKDIVAYAARRHITIVPEIEMPGHASAVLAAYPELSCTGKQVEVAQKWGVFKDVFCVKDETFEFIEDVLREVVELFPGEYVHVGGDECPSDQWKACENCRSLMNVFKLKDEHELHGYFMQSVQRILFKMNKKMIGWDEIIDGGPLPKATVMSWRGTRGGIAAAQAGNDVVMSPTTFCYFDFYQSKYPGEPLAIGGYLPLERVYDFEPVPDVLSEVESKHILGAQANVWTEYIKSPEQVEYMTMPRMSALSEVLWSDKKDRSYEAYTKRLISHFKLLDFKKINYSKAIFDIHEMVLPHSVDGAVAIDLSTAFRQGVIRYTINGEEPQGSSPVYQSKIVVDQSIGIKAKIFDGSIARGKEYSRVFKINLATGKEIILGNPPHEEYSRGGGFTLVNGITGNIPWMGSDWLGFLGEGLDATIDLGKEMNISNVGLDVLRDENSWIYYPKGVRVMVSNDGLNFTNLIKLEEQDLNPEERLIKMTFDKTKTRWVRVLARNYGTIPANKPGEGKPAWLLVDEITIN
ncbi:MAG TPA: family 20 glycosylhydrolase [Bacteroidia bacterium]|nr:family 20 glycosylhydrolase [Bacteroidia bacterium]